MFANKPSLVWQARKGLNQNGSDSCRSPPGPRPNLSSNVPGQVRRPKHSAPCAPKGCAAEPASDSRMKARQYWGGPLFFRVPSRIEPLGVQSLATTKLPLGFIHEQAQQSAKRETERLNSEARMGLGIGKKPTYNTSPRCLPYVGSQNRAIVWATWSAHVHS